MWLLTLYTLFLGANTTAAECCGGWIAQNSESPYLKVNVCLDGNQRNTEYCGIGPCNMFGCNCDGGCRVADELTCFQNCVDLLDSEDNNCGFICSHNVTPTSAALATAQLAPTSA